MKIWKYCLFFYLTLTALKASSYSRMYMEIEWANIQTVMSSMFPYLKYSITYYNTTSTTAHIRVLYDSSVVQQA